MRLSRESWNLILKSSPWQSNYKTPKPLRFGTVGTHDVAPYPQTGRVIG
jgi:hypothetical protein